MVIETLVCEQSYVCLRNNNDLGLKYLLLISRLKAASYSLGSLRFLTVIQTCLLQEPIKFDGLLLPGITFIKIPLTVMMMMVMLMCKISL